MVLHLLLLILHILAATVWVGGMFFAHFCLRPAWVVLDPPLRLRLARDVMRRFFFAVSVAIGVLLATGLAMFGYVGMASAPVTWHVMFGIGLLMMALFGYIRFGLYPRLSRAVDESRWPDAGAVLPKIARLVSVNLALGVLVIGIAVWH